MFIVNNTKLKKKRIIIFTLNFTALNSVQMQPLSTAQSSPNTGLFQFPLPGNYTQVGGMPMKICSLRPDSKMCCSHLGRRARERWWQVSPPSLSRDLCLGVRREGATDPQGSARSAPPSRGGGADSWTQNKTLQTGHWGLGAAQGWALSDLGLLPDVLLGLPGFQKLFQACLEPCVLWALKNQNTNLFFFPLTITFLAVMHEFFLNHL